MFSHRAPFHSTGMQKQRISCGKRATIAGMSREADAASSPAAAEQAPEHYWHVPRLIAAWALTAVASILVMSLFGWETGRLEWLTVVVAFGTLATFALQLGTAQRQGFIARTALSVSVVVLIVALLALAESLLGW